MKSLISMLVQASVLFETANSFEFNGPKPTQVQLAKLLSQIHPEPTAKALLTDRSDFLGKLFGRQAFNTLCGYVDANINYPESCVSGYVCATNAFYGAAGCCNPSELEDCLLPTVCIPYGDYCDEECLEINLAYTSCGYLKPYCLTKAYFYDSIYYEYDCAAEGGFMTIELYAYSASVTQDEITTVAIVQQSKASSASATALAGDGGSGSVVYNCGSGSCGNNDDNSGNDNNIGNSGGNSEGGGNSGAKSAASGQAAAPAITLLTASCIFLFVVCG